MGLPSGACVRDYGWHGGEREARSTGPAWPMVARPGAAAAQASGCLAKTKPPSEWIVVCWAGPIRVLLGPQPANHTLPGRLDCELSHIVGLAGRLTAMARDRSGQMNGSQSAWCYACTLSPFLVFFSSSLLLFFPSSLNLPRPATNTTRLPS
ncbi:unnamed protein product [Protopolystoma xenopodis]|uniref:Uncharacterized protein n=1 Tax=Protopolystoma xenopodis TaxID=117903 RepID=A0A3S4ZU31_9PLAT|nr:unnamed protein product [Protopolystoma xenopodis]